MSKLRLILLAASLPIAASPMLLSAQTPVPASAFEAIELRGGGRVTVRHGARHRVTVLRGDLQTSRIEVERGNGSDPKLVIEACRSRCTDYRLEVEVVTPDVGALAIRGGGAVALDGRFPARTTLALAVSGGGTIDARPIRASTVTAAVRGGGTIHTDAQRQLTAAVQGGGAILYSGDPRTTVAIHGGGAVTRAR